MSKIEKESVVLKTDMDEVSEINNIGVAYDEESKMILLGFNREDDSFEKLFMMPADRLKDLVTLLFQAGIKFQTETNIDIGFGVEKNDEKSKEER